MSPLTAEQQSAQFVAEAQKLIDASELSPTEAESLMEAALSRHVKANTVN